MILQEKTKEENDKLVEDANEAIWYLTDYTELTALIRRCKCQQHYIAADAWEKMYKDRCGEFFIPLFELQREILYSLTDEELDRVVWTPAPVLIDILQLLHEKYPWPKPKRLYDMACAACACLGCPYLKQHLGYTCEECKKDGCTGYQGYCDE